MNGFPINVLSISELDGIFAYWKTSHIECRFDYRSKRLIQSLRISVLLTRYVSSKARGYEQITCRGTVASLGEAESDSLGNPLRIQRSIGQLMFMTHSNYRVHFTLPVVQRSCIFLPLTDYNSVFQMCNWEQGLLKESCGF